MDQAEIRTLQETLCCLPDADGKGNIVGYRVCSRLLTCSGHVPDVCLPDYQFVRQKDYQALAARAKAGQIPKNAIKTAMESLICQN